MDQKRKAEKDLRTEDPDASAAAVVVTPLKKKFRSERQPTGASTTSQIELEGNLKKCDGVKDEEDAKPVVKKEPANEDPKQSDEDAVNGDTVMGFERYPKSSNKTIMLEHYDFVRWARKQTDPYGRLEAFVAWSNTDEAKRLEVEGMGKEKFTFGQHKGETFAEVKESDPEYHKRYMYMLKHKGEATPGVLSRYMEFLKLSKKSSDSAAKGHKKREASTSRERNTNYVGKNKGNQVFPFGQHRGQTFWEVAQEDPSYHLRYKEMDPSPNAVLDRYIEWFQQYSPTRYVAHQYHRDDLAFAAGIVPIGFYGEQDDSDDYYSPW